MPAHKRVLFIERTLRNEKLGIMYLSASLKAAGHHADLIQTCKEDLDAIIHEYRPHFVAFSVTTGEHRGALETAWYTKQRYGIPNIFGGPHCTFFPELAYESDVDFVVQGQGERAIVDVVEGRVAPGFVKADPPSQLDDLPIPDRDIFYKYNNFRDNPMKNVITSRACPYKCAYCFNHSQLALAQMDGQTGQWFRRRSVHDVVAEINAIGDRYPLEKVLFIDDSFIQSTAWLDTFLKHYAHNVRLPWLCSVRVNRLTGQLAERMSQCGLEMVNYAIESADPDVQRRLLHRGSIANRHVIQAISLFERCGVRSRMQNMIGLPLANPLEDALNTLQFNMRHRVTDSWCSIFQPYPRTALGQYCVDQGYATEDQLYHCAESFFEESRLHIPDRRKLNALQKIWYFAVDARLSLDLVQILIRGEYDEQTCRRLQELRFRCARERLYALDGMPGNARRRAQGDERVLGASQSKEHGQSPTAHLTRTALSGTNALPEFSHILEHVRFGPQEQEHLRRYMCGEQVYSPPIYTIDDDTGELADPAVSIYIRGSGDPNRADIRRMPTAHFMRGMAEVRTALCTGAQATCAVGQEPPVEHKGCLAGGID